jgi:hypothetical protein
MVLIFAKISTIRANNIAHCWIAHNTATAILVSKDTNPGGGSGAALCYQLAGPERWASEAAPGWVRRSCHPG